MINTEKIISGLEDLKLQGMLEVYEAILSMPSHELPTIHELMLRLIQSEKQNRSEKQTKMYLKFSNIRYDAILDSVQCSQQRNITKDQLYYFADASFIRKNENILITGPTGSGKSYLACAIGRQACSMGFKTLYLNMNRFLERVTTAKIDGTYIKLLNYLEKIPLIILDDFGLTPLEPQVKLAILQMLEDRYQRRSTIITAQLPVSKWYNYLNEPTLADAIMDRLSASAHRIELKGESLRKKYV
jgi:DNA replication protein DnaC